MFCGRSFHVSYCSERLLAGSSTNCPEPYALPLSDYRIFTSLFSLRADSIMVLDNAKSSSAHSLGERGFYMRARKIKTAHSKQGRND